VINKKDCDPEGDVGIKSWMSLFASTMLEVSLYLVELETARNANVFGKKGLYCTS